MLEVRPPETVSMLTRDRTRLDADIYRPEVTGEFPVLLMRQPYGRKIASTVVYAHPSWYASHGYIVIIQDVRGRGTSEGEFVLFNSEDNDGLDTVNWAANLPGSTGKVGMYGFSYQGMTQLYAAATHPPALKTICPGMTVCDLYADWAYEGGAFCWQGNLGWAIQLAAETARIKKDAIAYEILYSASRELPLYERSPQFIEAFKKYDSFYNKWLQHPDPDEYWTTLSPHLEAVDLPMLHIGGWFDPYLRGTVKFYQQIASRSIYPQQLIVGPWAHLPWGRKVGAIDYGAVAASLIDQIQINWFDQFLKGENTGRLEMPPISLFEMGSNCWRTLDSWPNNPAKSYFLSSTGLASISDKEGFLMEEKPEKAIADVFVGDPWRPVPALGGHAGGPSGSFDRSHIDCRTDVLTYTSVPLGEDLYFAGDVAVEIFAIADTPSYDLCAVLSEVKPDGRVYNFTQGYLRVTGDRIPVKVQLQATCMRIAKGNALRLSLSAACFPAYAINLGTGQRVGDNSMMDAQIITITIKCGGAYPSRVLLPII